MFAIRFAVHFGYKCVALMYYRMRFNGSELFFSAVLSCWFISMVPYYTACCRSSSHALTLVAKHVYPSGVFKLILSLHRAIVRAVSH